MLLPSCDSSELIWILHDIVAFKCTQKYLKLLTFAISGHCVKGRSCSLGCDILKDFWN